MDRRDAAVLVFVWIGVQAALGAVLSVPSLLVMLDGGGTTLVGRAIALLPTLFLAWVAFRLFRDRRRLAEAVFPEADSHPEPTGPRDWHVLGVTLVGLYVLVSATPEFLIWVFELPAALRGTQSVEGGPLTGARVISATVDAAAGGLLLYHRRAAAERLLG